MVKVLFFGATADITGTRAVDVPAKEGLTAGQVLEGFTAANPRLASHKLHIALNSSYANGDDPVRDGDELAIFTPVSGG